MEIKPSIPWPPSPEELSAFQIPALVYNFIAWILSPKAEFCEERFTEVSPDVQRLIYSLAQDLVYCVSHGRVKTPKHVLLPMTVKSLTGKAELVTLLNRFGHGMSYSQVEELETALAEQQADKQKDGVVLPDIKRRLLDYFRGN